MRFFLIGNVVLIQFRRWKIKYFLLGFKRPVSDVGCLYLTVVQCRKCNSNESNSSETLQNQELLS